MMSKAQLEPYMMLAAAFRWCSRKSGLVTVVYPFSVVEMTRLKSLLEHFKVGKDYIRVRELKFNLIKLKVPPWPGK